MNKDVRLIIQGLQFTDQEENESVETCTNGIYYEKAGSHYVLYEEPFDESGNPIQSRIKFSENYLQLHKSGPVKTDMIFEPGQRNVAKYQTPYGTMQIGIDTKKMEAREELNHMILRIDYVMDVDGEFLADCKLDIDIHSI